MFELKTSARGGSAKGGKSLKLKANYIIGIDEVGRAASKRRASPHYIIGIDEVGRGPLAGPVVVAALAAPNNLKFKIKNFPPKAGQPLAEKFKTKLRDSKKLSPKQREIWFKWIKENLHYSIASVYPSVIDRINISNAANLAANRAFKKIIANYKIANCKIFLDGGLYLSKSLNSKSYILNSRTIIKGDEKIPAIALASIVAKVVRDKKMAEYHKKYPRYGFAQHKGYGTKKHIKAIKKHGISLIHRKSFKIH
ncbi:MAG: ribonuclease HII [Patescibacteria group bacterium]